MQHFRNRSEIRMGVKNDFPLLRPVSFLNKPSISLAKVQINKNAADFDQNMQNSKQLKVTISHKRILSGITSRPLSRQQLTKSNKKLTCTEDFNKKKFNTKQSQSQQEIKKDPNNNQSQVIERNRSIILSTAKTSTKQIGIVKGYAVNSHPGAINTINEDRVCIVTNMNRVGLKGKQISFFGIFDAKNGAVKAEYYRDYFHSYLLKDTQLVVQPEKVLRKAYEQIEKGFSDKSNPKTFSSFVIAIIFQEKAYFLEVGTSKCVISQNFGLRLDNPLQNAEELHRYSPKRLTVKNPLKFTSIPTSRLDFLILGSEGLFEINKGEQLGRKLWKSILQESAENFHVTLGLGVNKVMSEILMQSQSTKNVSMILVGFQNSFDCCRQCDKIELPYVRGYGEKENQILQVFDS